jgi:hypothetical protein
MWTLGVSFIGLAACKFLDRYFLVGGERFSQTKVGGVLLFVSAIGWIVGLLLLLPLKLLGGQSDKREIERQAREGQIKPAEMSPLRQAVFFANYGHLPKWLYMPFLVIGLLLTAIVAVIIVGLFAYLIGSL